MSTLLEQASLIMIPSGYKEDVVYSVIPENGNGDLSFTRASNGTRVNSAGLVEVVPWNFVEQSESIGTSPWLTNGATLTSGQTDPSGGTTAVKVQLASGGNNYVYQGIVLPNPINIVSAYLRADSATTIGFSMGGTTPNTVNLTTTWQLFTFSSADTSGGIIFDNYFGPSPSQQAKTFYIWHPQLNIGSTAKPYFPTTDRLNVPRLTYQNGGGGCPSLLLEKQSTNSLNYSEQLDNAGWSKGSNVSVTANSIISPDGTQNADTSTNSGPSAVYIYQLSNNPSVTWTASLYAKKGTNKYVGLSICAQSYPNERYQPVFNLDDGTIQAQNSSGTNVSNTSCSITSVGNGWYRITATGTFVAGSDNCFIVLQSSNNTNYQPDLAGSLDWQNATNGNCYYWGAQLEASSYPTSYIPTTSSSATRVADACFKTGISSLIGQTEGVIFIDYNYDAKPDVNGNLPMVIYDGSNEAYIFITGGGSVRLELYDGGVLQCLLTTSIGAVGRKKIAFGYKQNDFVGYMNGVQIATDTSGTVGAMLNLYVGSYYTANYNANGGINQAILFPTRLTNSELASLTTI